MADAATLEQKLDAIGAVSTWAGTGHGGYWRAKLQVVLNYGPEFMVMYQTQSVQQITDRLHPRMSYPTYRRCLKVKVICSLARQ